MLRPESRVAHQRAWPRDATLGPKAKPRGQMDAASGPSSVQMSIGHFFQALSIASPAAIECAVPIRTTQNLRPCRAQELAFKIFYQCLIAPWPDRANGKLQHERRN